ncbi:RE1 [Symbiodinium sp. CCMP2592]|nr:RE1 [Symbiodinium sp. CCMP2592]
MSSGTGSAGRTREGVPIWDGDPGTFVEFSEAVRLYEQGTAPHKRAQVGPRVAAELTGAARRFISGQAPDWLSHYGGAEALLSHLRQGLGKPRVSEVTDHLTRLFKYSKRKAGDGEDAKDRDKVHDLEPRRKWWSADVGDTHMEPPHLHGECGRGRRGRRRSGGDRHGGDENVMGLAARQLVELLSVLAGYGSTGYGWGSGSWPSSSTINVNASTLPELLPDFVQGWLLLQDAGLDANERGLVLTTVGEDFRVATVANALRAHFPDGDLRRRDGGKKQLGYWGSVEDESDTEDYGDTFQAAEVAENLNDEGFAMWNDAQDEIAEAMAVIGTAKRTLKDARAKQHAVKMSRQYYRVSGKGSGKFGSQRRTPDDSNLICMGCGRKGHRVANCPNPQNPPSAQMAENETASFICYSEGPAAQETAYATGITTREAVQQGKAVMDCGATRSIGSVLALEKLMEMNIAQHGEPRVIEVDRSDRPIFGFGNSSTDRCASTVKMGIQAGNRQGVFRIHALNKGDGPILMSIEAMTMLGALVDFSANLAVFRKLDPTKLIPIERSATGHMLVPLSGDLFKKAIQAVQTIPGLEIFVPKEHGEQVPKQWTKVELLQRIEEVTGRDLTREKKSSATEASEYRVLVRDLNQASRRKAELQKFCAERLNMNVNHNLTIAQLQKDAMAVIASRTPPEPADFVGFGKHASLSYALVKENHPEYCRWVVQTAREGQCNPRLLRLAGWLENDVEKVQRAQKEIRDAKTISEAKGMFEGYPVLQEPVTPRGSASSSTMESGRRRVAVARSKAASRKETETADEDVKISKDQLAALITTMETLKDEVASLKCERPRKKVTSEESEDVSLKSMLGDKRAVYVALGVYAYGNHYGITNRSMLFPRLRKYLNRFMENWSGGPFCKSSLVVSWNNLLPLHRDANNDSAYKNHVIGLGTYQHGELWLQSTDGGAQRRQLPSGEWIQGGLHDIKGKVLKFSPTLWHQTQKWSGERFTIAAFVSRGSHCLSQEQRERAKQLGFTLPPVARGKAEIQPAQAMTAETQSKKEDELIMRQLYKLHSATGHGSVKTMIDALKRRGAPQKVLDVASRFVCSACQERKRPPPRHLASLELLPPRWHTISADVGHWTHPRSGEIVQFLLIIDEGSRFRIAKVLSKGSRQQPSAANCLEYLREGWIQVFGRPDVLRLDPAGSFRGQQVENFCDRHSIFLDVIPADAHWQIGVCEQAVKGIKHVMERACAGDEQLTSEEALSLAVGVFNSREQVRGFTPIQHAFGRNPDVTGRLIARPDQLPDELLVENAVDDFARAAQSRAEAEKALCDWQAKQRISRAMNSRSRPQATYHPGDLVFFWRTQESGKSRRAPGTSHGRFLGPARILATEGRREPDGSHRPGSAIWLVRGRSLLKCCPEQLRPASPREELLEALAAGRQGEQTPWTFQRIAEEIGGTRYEDITGERPSPSEWHRAQDPMEETPPTRFRVRGKRPAREPDEELLMDLEDEEDEPSQPSRPSRPRTTGPQGLQTERQEAWWSRLSDESFPEASSFWTDAEAAVEVAIDMPSTSRGVQGALKNLSGYFVSALKRKAIEVSEKRLNEGDRASFREAKAVEVKNFVASRAFEALPPEVKPDKSQAMGMRWILTWKTREDGSQKAKARAVLLGYQDPAYAHRSTTSPVMTRQTRQMLLQTAAIRKWAVYKGDVSGAFLQGRDYPDQLLCIPCDEICAAMNLEAGSVVRLKKACYGLVDAPLEWYRTVAEFLEAQGMERMWSDACAWVLRKEGKVVGVISGHVDDFLFSGDEQDADWLHLIQAVKDRFRWGDWDKDTFVQCGVQVTREGNSFKLSQAAYVESIPEINVRLLGAISWHAQQVLATEVLSIKGAERKANLELLSVKEAQMRTELQVRWVHSEAQLGNSLTKQNGGHELELFYKMRHAWRIVEDPAMRSARKRKADGVPPLASHADQSQVAVEEIESITEEAMFQDHVYDFFW